MTDDKNTDNESNPAEGSTLFPEHPTHIGAYRILDVLGEGGMAVVYLAEQSEPVKRRVALKIVKLGMDSKQVVARFESERQALAVLDHPNIAKVFDGGITESGRPYFVMELVHGVPITDYCDDHRLSTSDRVELFITVCSAVQHAHHKGLIHRDLKPSNLLVGVVDGKPQVKIIDFGIAKATSTSLTDKTLFTRIGQLIGTPQYMSPEQANITGLDVDTRTDIYSLGVVFYELLVGVVPIDLTAVGEQAIRVAVRERDAPRPSTRITGLGDTGDEIAKARGTDPEKLQRQIKGDLDWVVMRAIAKDRTRRYATANALAMECQRFLNHEPVLARPPSAGYILQRFIRRNRVMVIAGSVALVAILAGAVAATIGFVQATEAEQAALREAETARQVSDFLVELFEVSDPSEARGNAILAREILDRGADAIDKDLADQPEVQAALMFSMAKVYQNLGLLQEAEALMENALNARRGILPDPHAQIADVLNEMIGLQILLGDITAAEEFGNQALEMRRAVLGNLHVDVGHTLASLAVVDYYQAEYQNSRDLFRQALDVFEATIGEDHPDAIDAMSSLGSLYWRTGELDEAERLLRLVLERKRRHVGDDHPDVAVMLNNLSILLKDTGRPEEAEPFALEALVMQKKQLGEHPLVANTMNNIGLLYLQQGDIVNAESMLHKALAMWSKTLGDNHMKVHTAKHNLGLLNIDKGDLDQAEKLLLEAESGRRETLGADHESTAETMMLLCDVYNLTGRYDESERTARRVIEILEQTLPEGHRKIAAAKIRLGSSLAGLGQYEEAETLILTGFSTIQDIAPGSLIARRSWRWVIRLYESWGKPDEAARYREWSDAELGK